MRRLRIEVHGVVQGVGFRPFVHAEATRRGLSGWVRNRPDGVAIEVQGPEEAIGSLVRALTSESPPAARVDRIVSDDVPLAVESGFVIAGSDLGSVLEASLPADLAICRECKDEILVPGGRRSGYPFTNCAHCGPRYTIIEALPYDRERTSMRRFEMCRACAAEHGDRADRRFHAQPIACPACGPSLRLLAPDGDVTARGAPALDATTAAIAAGRVLAVKGLGGFHLLVDAANAGAVESLRTRKGREEKPFAVMFASLDAVRAQCEVSVAEADALTSAAAPIVLLKRRTFNGVAANVAPGNARLGVLLPYSPLHALLLEACGGPLVCTSGNRSEEPICTDEDEALARLRGIADGFLVHDRPIVRPVDDSIVQGSDGGMQLLRRSRGYVPTAIPLLEAASSASSAHVLAVGGHLKNTVAVAFGGRIVLSQHLGDLTSPEAVAAQERAAADLVRFFDVHPTLVACDLHPDYASTRLAERLAASWGARLERVQHHHAHVAACAAEHGISGPILGLAWDGAGFGTDGVVWGSEALWVERERWHRVAHLRPFSLPGGEAAMREPRRAALGLLHAIGEPVPDSLIDPFTAREAAGLTAMLDSGVRCPPTTSVGRLFDAVSSLLGLRQRASFEGQAAMDLEWAAAEASAAAPYSLPLGGGEPAIADWEPCLRAVLEDRRRGVVVAKIAARFHATLAALAVDIAERAGLPRVALTGGCFQNTLLTRLVADRLRGRGFDVLMAQRVPPNDGGLAFGQAAVALWRGLGQKD